MGRTIAVAVLLCTLTVACSSPATPTTTAGSGDGSIVFGSGVVPDAVPDSFPIPSQAVVGSTLEDRDTGRVEVVLTLPADPEAVVDYYEANLPARGYEITDSRPGAGGHIIDFDGEGMVGSVLVQLGGSSASAVAITMTPAS